MSSGGTVQVAFGRGHLPLKIPQGAEVTIIRKAVLAKLPDQRAAERAQEAAPAPAS